MATGIYAAGYIFLDGQLLTQELTVDVDYDANNNVIVTQALGFAGVSPGAPRFTARVSNAVPLSGHEYDFYGAVSDHTAVELVFHMGGKKRISKGFLMRLNEKAGVDTSSTTDFEFEGDVPEII